MVDDGQIISIVWEKLVAYYCCWQAYDIVCVALSVLLWALFVGRRHLIYCYGKQLFLFLVAKRAMHAAWDEDNKVTMFVPCPLRLPNIDLTSLSLALD